MPQQLLRYIFFGTIPIFWKSWKLYMSLLLQELMTRHKSTVADFLSNYYEWVVLTLVYWDVTFCHILSMDVMLDLWRRKKVFFFFSWWKLMTWLVSVSATRYCVQGCKILNITQSFLNNAVINCWFPAFWFGYWNMMNCSYARYSVSFLKAMYES